MNINSKFKASWSRIHNTGNALVFEEITPQAAINIISRERSFAVRKLMNSEDRITRALGKRLLSYADKIMGIAKSEMAAA